jgi:hypothetical protein
VTFKRSEKPADAATSNRLRKRALGNSRRLSASKSRPSFQAAASPDTFVRLGSIADRALLRWRIRGRP